jgi:NOL1/NOP2/fmu family ribosome biogenesis protein
MIEECPPRQQSLVIEYFEKRFGIERLLFNDFEFYVASKGRIYLGPKNLIDKPKPVTAGMLIARISRSIKPTTIFFQLFGKYVKRNLIALNKEKAHYFIQGEDLDLPVDELLDASDGYVLVTYRGFPLGCSLLKGNSLRNKIPKSKRLDLDFL